MRCREEELRKAMMQQKIQEELLKKREQVPIILDPTNKNVLDEIF